MVLLCEILKTKQKQTKYREQTSGYQGVGVGAGEIEEGN